MPAKNVDRGRLSVRPDYANMLVYISMFEIPLAMRNVLPIDAPVMLRSTSPPNT